MSELIIPKGTIVHVGGFPFTLLCDTKVIGRKENMDLAMLELHPSKDDPCSVHFQSQVKSP